MLRDEGLSSPMDAMPPSRHSENGSAFDAADGTLAATANGASSCRSPPSSPRYAGLSSQSFSNGAHADEANGVDHGAVSLKRMMPALQLSENIYRVLEFGNDITKLSKSLRPRHQVKHKKRMQVGIGSDVFIEAALPLFVHSEHCVRPLLVSTTAHCLLKYRRRSA